MIQDARVLREEFIPNEVVHRHSEMNQVSAALEPVLNDEPPEDALLVGPTGAGKTCIAKYSIERLRRQVLAFDWTYVNCWDDHTKFRVLYRLLEGIDDTFDVHRQATPRDELVRRLREHDDRYLAILDEVDQLHEKEVLYDLANMPHITLLLIANREEEVFVDLDDRIVSRLRSARRVRFAEYSVDELVDILADRVEWGLGPGAIDADGLERIARVADGDARVAIGVLRRAARQADRQNVDRITRDLLEAVIPDARRDLRQQSLEKLTDDQRTLYRLVEETGEIAPGDLYDAYAEAVKDPMSERTVRNYLAKLVRYDLLEAEGEGPSRTYRLVE